MAGRRTNLALLVALVLAVGTGVAAFSVGVTSARWVIILHGMAGIAVVILSPWKTLIARRGLRKARSGNWLGVALAAVTAVVVITGVLFSAGLVLSYGFLSAMQLHVGAAFLSLVMALAHLYIRPVSARRLDVDRRQALRLAGLGAGAAAGWLVLDRLNVAAGFPGADRRFTGSHEQGSGDPARMPVTQWFNDSVPEIDLDSWALAVRDLDGAREVSYGEIDNHGYLLEATLDCTGGWFAHQEWRGARLDSLVRAGADQSIVVRAGSGYARRFPASEAGRLVLATQVAGEPLSRGHGYPLRLVAPGRRGFWWVKWIVKIEVDDRPWWLQSPFPLE